MSYDILFVDDSEAMQKSVSMVFLDNQDFTLNSLYDGSTLLDIIRKHPPSIIIINYNLSNASSYDLVAKIKNDSELAKFPVLILVPSDLSNKERELFVQAGVNGFIYRPFEKDMFIDKIKRVLGIIEMPERKDEERIYDISTFEKKQDAQEDRQDDAMWVNKESNDGIVIDSDSTELSEAFEKLFKDNSIFKEFQELNTNISEPPAESAKTQNEENYNQQNIETQNEEVSEPQYFNIADILSNNDITDTEKNIYTEAKGFNIFGEEDTGKTDELGGLLNNTVNKKGGIIKLEILTEDIIAKMDDYFKRSIDDFLNEIKPQIIENIKIVLPEIAEKLIRIEIEKVKNIGEQDSHSKEDTKNEDI